MKTGLNSDITQEMATKQIWGWVRERIHLIHRLASNSSHPNAFGMHTNRALALVLAP